MCQGGGGGATYDPTYQQNIDRQNRLDAEQRQRNIDAQAATAKSTADAANAASLQSATANAPNVTAQYFADRGLPGDPGTIQRIVDSITRTIPAGDPNPAQYYSSDAIAGEVAKIEQANRQGYNAQVNQYFAPGFERSLLPDTAADPIVSSILGEQRGAANTALDFNKARGVLNDTGYNTARSALDTQGAAAGSTIRSLANSVLGKDRQGLLDIRGEAGDAASSYAFGQPAPDFGSYRTRANTLAATDLGDIEGSVRGAVGGTNYFDVPTALQKGGTLQGPINLTTASAPGGAPPIDPSRRTQAGRGVGSTGIF